MKNRFNKIKTIELLIVCLSIYFPLFLFNLGINISRGSRNQERISNDQEKILEARSDGFVPYYIPKETFNFVDRFYPLGGKPNSKTYFCNEGYGLVKYQSDRFGLRNDDKKWDSINSYEERAFFIGDSFVHGSCVNNKETISEVFQKESGILSFNLGSAGATPVHYEAFMKMFLNPLLQKQKKLKSDSVFLIFYFNDNCRTCNPNKYYFDNANEDFFPIIPANNNLRLNPKYNENIDKVAERVENDILLKKSNNISQNLFKLQELFTLKILKIHFGRYLYSIGLRRNYNENDATEKAIFSLNQLCKNKCKAYISYIPPSAKDNVYGSERYKSHIKKISRKYGIKFIDLQNIISGNNKSDFAPKGSHLSIAGYEEVGQFLNKSK